VVEGVSEGESVVNKGAREEDRKVQEGKREGAGEGEGECGAEWPRVRARERVMVVLEEGASGQAMRWETKRRWTRGKHTLTR